MVGAHAVAFHARPRATKDLYLLLDPTPANARRLQAALRDFFGGIDSGYSVEDLTDPRWIIQIGVAPVTLRDVECGSEQLPLCDAEAQLQRPTTVTCSPQSIMNFVHPQTTKMLAAQAYFQARDR